MRTHAHIRLNASAYGASSMGVIQAIQALAYVLGYDVWFYAMHRTIHHPALYAYHKKHHSVRRVTWRETYVADTLENVLTPMGLVIPLPIVGFSWPAMLGAWAYCAVRAVAHHEPRCAKWAGDYHLKHHADMRYNFGQPWLDRLLGTAA